MANPFVYQVQFMPNADEQDYTGHRESGLVYAESYGDAATKIEKYYGNELLLSICYLSELEDGCIVIPHEVCENIEKDGYIGEYDD